MIPLCEIPRIDKAIETERRLVVARGLGGGDWGGDYVMCMRYSSGMMKKVLKRERWLQNIANTLNAPELYILKCYVTLNLILK